jgi:regulator of protease activity HflC (stomatin/prohibitin superfamily)
MSVVVFVVVIALIAVVIASAASVKIVREFERGVVFRLGRVVAGAKGPGLFFVVPIADKMVKVNLQTVTVNVSSQEVITRDNVTVEVDAVAYFSVTDSVKSVVNVQNYMFATSQVAQTTMRNVCGTAELDELLAERERLNSRIKEIVDEQTDPWGVTVTLVEIKNITLAQEVQRAMARQAEAERDRRAKVINAQGEYEAAEKLGEAAQVIAREPIAYHLRMLETMSEVAAENNSTLVLPIPVELLGGVGRSSSQGSWSGGGHPTRDGEGR